MNRGHRRIDTVVHFFLPRLSLARSKKGPHQRILRSAQGIIIFFFSKPSLKSWTTFISGRRVGAKHQIASYLRAVCLGMCAGCFCPFAVRKKSPVPVGLFAF